MMDLMKPMQVRWSWVPFGSGWSWGLKLFDWNWWNWANCETATMERRVLRVLNESLNLWTGKVLRVVSCMVKQKMGRPHMVFRLDKRLFGIGIYSILGGGNSNIFSPRNLGKMNPIFDSYFSDGLVQPPTSYSMHQNFGRFWMRDWRLEAVPPAKDCCNSISGALESIRRYGSERCLEPIWGKQPARFQKAHLRDPDAWFNFEPNLL